MRTRRGFTMLEVIVALGILAIPVLMLVNLIQENVASAHYNQDRMVGQLILNDLCGFLSGQDLEKLKELSDGDVKGMDLLLEGRVAGLPDHLRDRFRTQMQHLFGQISFKLQPDFGGVKGMARLELTALLPTGSPLTTLWFLRLDRRVDHRAPPPPDYSQDAGGEAAPAPAPDPAGGPTN